MFAPPVTTVRGRAPASSDHQSAYPSLHIRLTRPQPSAPTGPTTREAALRNSQDFSAVSIFPLDPASQTELPARWGAPPTLGVLQAKLAIGRVDDPLEYEADRIADQVMRVPAHEVGVTRTSAAPRISRKCQACGEEEEKVQRKEAGTAGPGLSEVSASVHPVLRSPRQPLDEATRGYFEPRFGYDFSHVRVHSGTTAGRSARNYVAETPRFNIGELGD